MRRSSEEANGRSGAGNDVDSGQGHASRDVERVPRALISVAEAARVLGVSRSYAYELISSGFLSSIRLGRRVLVPLTAIDDLLAREAGDF